MARIIKSYNTPNVISQNKWETIPATKSDPRNYRYDLMIESISLERQVYTPGTIFTLCKAFNQFPLCFAGIFDIIVNVGKH